MEKFISLFMAFIYSILSFFGIAFDAPDLKKEKFLKSSLKQKEHILQTIRLKTVQFP